MDGMFDGIAREAEGDDLVDRASQPVHPDVGEAVGQIGPKLPAETVLRRQDQVGVIPLWRRAWTVLRAIVRCPPSTNVTSDVTTRIRFFLNAVLWSTLSQGFVGFLVVVRLENEERVSRAGRAAVAVFDVDDGVAEESADFRAGADPVADLDGDDLVRFDFVAERAQGGFRFFIVGRDEQEMAFLFLRINAEALRLTPALASVPRTRPRMPGSFGVMTWSSVSMATLCTVLLLPPVARKSIIPENRESGNRERAFRALSKRGIRL